LDPVILAFLLPTTLKRYCIQTFAARYFSRTYLPGLRNSRNKGYAKKTGFTILLLVRYWRLPQPAHCISV